MDKIANQRLTLAFGATSSINGAESVMIEASPTLSDTLEYAKPFKLKIVVHRR